VSERAPDGPILVVGATGMLGRPVAERLRQLGTPVRVLARSPAKARAMLGDGFEYREGDVSHPCSLDAAMAGCSGVHINLRGQTAALAWQVEVCGTRHLAAACARAGVERLTYLSGAGVESADPRHPSVRVKQTAEAAIRDSGVPFTILRATHFMESLNSFVRGKAAVIPGRQPHPYHYIAAADYAKQVAAAFAKPEAANRAFTLFGPDAFTMRQALEQYRDITRPELKVRTMPLPLLKLMGRLTGSEELAMVAALFAAFREFPETGDPEPANRVLSPATTTLDDWLQEEAKRSQGGGRHQEK
jgi:uncharacterized protein YbjT (DUF2867 family)